MYSKPFENFIAPHTTEYRYNGCDLSGAILYGTNLTGADLTDAKVTNALFIGVIGLSDDEKIDLRLRGAILNISGGRV